MRFKKNSTTVLFWSSIAFALFACGSVRADAGDLKLETQLIWGTNDAQSPNPKHKPVEMDVRKKLKDLPLKWNNYFEVNRKRFGVPLSGSTKVPLSEKCSIEVKNLGKSMIEVTLAGNKRTQKLPKGETLVLAGNAPNATSWLVVLKRIE